MILSVVAFHILGPNSVKFTNRLEISKIICVFFSYVDGSITLFSNYKGDPIGSNLVTALI